MDRYKKLTVNTLILTVGTVGSKIVTFLMLPFYTNILTRVEYGTIDLLLQTGGFLMPLCTAGISAAIIRFGLDDHYDKKDVFMTGLACYGFGLGSCLLLILAAEVAAITPGIPFPHIAERVRLYGFWILALIASSGLHAICGAFVRAREKMRIYALTGILNTVCNVLLMILFLNYLRLGIGGYMLAVVAADLISALFLIFSSRLWAFIKPWSSQLPTARDMTRYSIPLIPATISWWVINMSDRFMISAFIETGANGIYSVAAKIPSIVTIMAGVFMEAWQVSIIGEKSDKTAFFSNIMKSYQSLLFIMAGGVTLFSRLIITLMTSPDFYEASLYVPILLSSTVFSCLATFVGSIYTVEKKSVSQLVTTMTGAVSNIILNLLLIPLLGIYGAAISTLLSFMIIFIIRLIDTRKYVKLDWAPPRFCVSFLLLMVQITVTAWGEGPIYIAQAACFVALAAVNSTPLLDGARKLKRRRRAS